MRVLTSQDDAALLALITRQPEVNVFVASVVHSSHQREIWGHFSGDTLESALHVGSNLVPVQLTQDAARDFAETLRNRQRTYSSLVGPKESVDMLWELLGHAHGPARLVRQRQPYLMLDGSAQGDRHLSVRKAHEKDLNSYFVAAVDMFRNEVELDPIAHGDSAYRARVLDSIKAGKSFGWFDDGGNTLFKTDVGAVAGDICQIQGVWLAPHLRGRGMATPLFAAALDHIQREIAPRVCLYVNDFNHAALKVYARVGFRAISQFATVFL